ncbi:thiamine phosphate synthase [Trichloromonas sp.]|uniref:thiamine phosphate synthase n=1 Tax=Trichloromonas sp. TaxID=3069249 RepID=UPI002A3DF1C7|nr:thiamine phosphate synthase [Trichloromonas sp.]
MPNPIDFNLYLITDRRQIPGGDLISAVRAALRGGVRAVQLREKDLTARELLPAARELRELTRAFGAKLLINDRIDVALAVAADGVHLGGHSFPVAEARALLGPHRLIGLSTHHREEISLAARDGADFVTFGPVWFTPSKAAYGAPVGLAALRDACVAAPLPIFPLGGVTVARLAELVAVRCPRAACIGAILAAPSPEDRAREFVRLLSPPRS